MPKDAAQQASAANGAIAVFVFHKVLCAPSLTGDVSLNNFPESPTVPVLGPFDADAGFPVVALGDMDTIVRRGVGQPASVFFEHVGKVF